MSEHEAELRSKLAAEGADVHDIMHWFLEAIGAQACVDGGPEPDLSWFEREFLKDNVERYHDEHIKRMPMDQLLNEWATTAPAHLGRPLIDVSGWSDVELIHAITDDHYSDSVAEELIKRANAGRITVAEYVYLAAKKALGHP
jgi:hypothetical protein